jgi:hypothetical protein
LDVRPHGGDATRGQAVAVGGPPLGSVVGPVAPSRQPRVERLGVGVGQQPRRRAHDTSPTCARTAAGAAKAPQFVLDHLLICRLVPSQHADPAVTHARTLSRHRREALICLKHGNSSTEPMSPSVSSCDVGAMSGGCYGSTKRK